MRSLFGRRSDVDDDRERTVIAEFDAHVRTESACLDREPTRPQSCGHGVDQRFGDRAGSRVAPRRTATLRSAPVQGELTDDENSPAGVLPGHFPVNDAQLRDLADHRLDLLGAVRVRGRHEREEAGARDAGEEDRAHG